MWASAARALCSSAASLPVACLVLAAEVQDRAVVTIEHATDVRIARLRRAFSEEAALQCGFCTPGMILAASRLPPNATATRIRVGACGQHLPLHRLHEDRARRAARGTTAWRVALIRRAPARSA